MNGNQIKYFSMFTGVGGFEIGIGDKAECVGFSEIDKYASQLLAKRFPNTPNFGDCTKIEADKLPDFDMLCGGFPCQSFSIAGKRRGFEDTRGTMFFEIARILKAKRPGIVFLENVKGLLNHDKGETFKVILQTLEELGYRTQWMVLNSKFFGVPQNRERIFIIGSLGGIPRPEILPFSKCNSNSTEQSDKNLPQSQTIPATYYKGGKGEHIQMIQKSDREFARIYSPEGISPALHLKTGGYQEPKIGVSSIAIRNKNRSKHQNNSGESYGDYEKEYQVEENKEGISYAVKSATQEFMIAEKTRDVSKAISVAQEISLEQNKPVQLDVMHLQHGELRPLSTYIPQGEEHRALQAGEPKELLIQGMKIRKLTPTECERLQGFPDGWTEGFSDTQRYKMMGNAVTTKVIKAIAERLI